jgi:hypothetical protein
LDTGWSLRFLKSNISIDYIFTTSLCNCVGIAVHTKTEFGLMHAFPENGVEGAVEFVKSFTKEGLKISLISAQYTPFLGELYPLLLKECDSIPLHCIGSIVESEVESEIKSESIFFNIDRTSTPLNSLEFFKYLCVHNRVCIHSSVELSQSFDDEIVEQYEQDFGDMYLRYEELQKL